MRTKHQLILDSPYDPIARMLLEQDPTPWYIPERTREYLYSEYKKKCAICGKVETRPHIDHITPVAHGGTCKLENLQILCEFCNLSKSSHALDPRSYQVGYVITIPIVPERSLRDKILDRVEGECY